MIELQKGDWDIRGTWHPAISKPYQGPVIRNAIICCPTCGTDAPLPAHAIADDGMVTPDYVCRSFCGFHDMVKLLGWDPNA